MRPLIEKMAQAVDVFFKADRALMDHPSPETFAEAKRTYVELRAAERREYQSMVEDGDLPQDACDEAGRLADECGGTYEAWLVTVEEQLKNPQAAVETAAPCLVVESIALPNSSALIKTKDRAFF